MKFQFCGNLSCPEWFLAESAVLSKITSIKLKLILGHLVTHILDGVDNSAKVIQMLENSGFNPDEVSALLAAIEFVLLNSVRYDITDQILLKELIDLGLPKENCESFSKVYKENREKLKTKQISDIPRISRIGKIDYAIGKVLISDKTKKMNSDNSSYAELQVEFKENTRDLSLVKNKITFTLDQSLLAELNSEMLKVQALFEKF